MNEFDKQKFLETAKNIFLKQKRTTRDQQILRQFFKTSKSWDFWQKLTKNSDKLLDKLIESFSLQEFECDTPIQLKGNEQEKFVILLVQGFVEVRYESANPFGSNKEILTNSSALAESKFTEQDSSLAESNISNEKSPKGYKFQINRRKATTQTQQNKQRQIQEVVQQIKEMLKDKGKTYKHYSSSDLDFIEVSIPQQNKKRINEKTFLQMNKLQKKVFYYDDDDHNDYYNGRNMRSKSQQKREILSPYISLSTKFESGDVMNSYLLNNDVDSQIDYDVMSYVALTQISFLTLQIEQIEIFLQERNNYLQLYNQYLDQFFVSDIFQNQFKQDQINQLKNRYIINENIQQGDNVITSKVKSQKIHIYLIKEGFFDLKVESKKNKQIQIQNQYSFVGSDLNQKQIITIQDKKNGIQYQTIAMMQKGQLFGEEILFNSKKCYQYTVCKKSPYSEIIEFKFNSQEDIPQPFYEYIVKQYKFKQSIEIESDQEDDNEQQVSISARYSSIKGTQKGSSRNRDNFKNHMIDLNSSQYVIDMEGQNKINSNNCFISQQNKQQSIKKITLNDTLNPQLSSYFHNNSSFDAKQSPLGFDQQRQRCYSSENKFRNKQFKNQDLQDQPELKQQDQQQQQQLSVSIVPHTCRKNKFVKKAQKIERPTSPSPKSFENIQTNNYLISLKNQYFPPIHSISKLEEQQLNIEINKAFTSNIEINKISQNNEVYKVIPQNNLDQNNKINQNVVSSSKQQYMYQQTQEKTVKTIKILFDTPQESSSEINEKRLSSSFLFEKNILSQNYTARQIHSSNSTKRIKGELMTGRSRQKFNQLMTDFNGQNIQNQNQICEQNQDQNSECKEQEDQDHEQNILIIQKLQIVPQNQPQTERVITDGLKQSKIRRSSPQEKLKREESQKKGELIKLLYKIEHEKWIKQQQMKDKLILKMQQRSSSSSSNPQLEKQNKYFRQPSNEPLLPWNWNGGGNISNGQNKQHSKNDNQLNKDKIIKTNNSLLDFNKRARSLPNANNKDKKKSLKISSNSNNKNGVQKNNQTDKKANTTNNFYQPNSNKKSNNTQPRNISKEQKNDEKSSQNKKVKKISEEIKPNRKISGTIDQSDKIKIKKIEQQENDGKINEDQNDDITVKSEKQKNTNKLESKDKNIEKDKQKSQKELKNLNETQKNKRVSSINKEDSSKQQNLLENKNKDKQKNDSNKNNKLNEKVKNDQQNDKTEKDSLNNSQINTNTNKNNDQNIQLKKNTSDHKKNIKIEEMKNIYQGKQNNHKEIQKDQVNSNKQQNIKDTQNSNKKDLNLKQDNSKTQTEKQSQNKQLNQDSEKDIIEKSPQKLKIAKDDLNDSMQKKNKQKIEMNDHNKIKEKGSEQSQLKNISKDENTMNQNLHKNTSKEKDEAIKVIKRKDQEQSQQNNNKDIHKNDDKSKKHKIHQENQEEENNNQNSQKQKKDKIKEKDEKDIHNDNEKSKVIKLITKQKNIESQEIKDSIQSPKKNRSNQNDNNQEKDKKQSKQEFEVKTIKRNNFIKNDENH